MFYCYHINGELISQSEDSAENLISPCIGRDGKFSNYLVYFRHYDNILAIRKLPYLERYMKIVSKGVTCFTLLLHQRQIIAGNNEGKFTLIGDPETLPS